MTHDSPTSLREQTSRIDLHSHFLPHDYVWYLRKNGETVAPKWSAHEHLEFMDTFGIATSVLSIPQYFHAGDQRATNAVACCVNEAGRAILDEYGGRFAVHATLPLPDVSAAIDELAYALDDSRLDGGVLLFTNYEGVYLGDPAFEPLYEELDRRGAVAWVHPPAHAPHDEMPLETTRAAANLMHRGVLERYPSIKWQLSHVGGQLLHVLSRLSTVNGTRPTAQHLYYDTALGTSDQLLSVKNLTGVDRLLFGTDYPYVTRPALPGLVDEVDRALVERGNALELYPRLAG